MQFIPTPLSGSFLIKLDAHIDERGSFARAWCRREMTAAGLHADFVQWNISGNPRAGTLRGMGLETAPHEEIKIVSCEQGRIFDVIIDLRQTSKTYTQWFGHELRSNDFMMMYVPSGFAHGFITIDDYSTVHYHISNYYAPDAARGVRWDDPFFGITWPIQPTLISERDATYEYFC